MPPDNDNTQADPNTNPQPESTSPETPQTPIPPVIPTNSDRQVQILEALVREQNARIQAMQDARPATIAPAPAVSVEDSRTSYFNDPETRTRAILKEEMERTIAPLMELARGFRGEGTPYNSLKSQFKNDPRFKDLLSDPNIESAVDAMMAKSELKAENMTAALVNAAGLKMTGQLETVLIANGIRPSAISSTPAPSPMPVTPPHIRPSAPPSPNTPEPTKRRELTENELRLARERRMTKDVFLDWIEAPAGEVATSKIGRAS